METARYMVTPNRDDSELLELHCCVGATIVCTQYLDPEQLARLARLLLKTMPPADAHDLACDFVNEEA